MIRAAVVIALLPVLSAAAVTKTPEIPARVRALAILMQVSGSLEENVAAGELGQVHNEDEFLYAALAALGAEATRDQRTRVEALIPVLARSVADMHAAADAFDRPLAVSRLRPTLDAFAQTIAVFPPDEVAAARLLAGRFTCPMHPDVSGERGGLCPKCGMPLDARRRVWIGRSPDTSRRATVTASICTDEPLRVGEEARGILKLTGLMGEPLLFKDLREVHTKKIHLLIVDPSLSDYHHEHPLPTDVPGEYAFRFTPRVAGSYRAYADVQPLLTGLQEYARSEIVSVAPSRETVERTYATSGEAQGLRYELTIDAKPIKVGAPASARVRVTKDGQPFAALEPVMAAFAHLVAFREGGDVVLHMHPLESRALNPDDRGGPELAFRFFADTPGYYRLFLQTQVDGRAQFVAFGVDVEP
jgi:hypothetical protein